MGELLPLPGVLAPASHSLLNIALCPWSRWGLHGKAERRLLQVTAAGLQKAGDVDKCGDSFGLTSKSRSPA